MGGFFGISFCTRARSAMLASRFSNGIACAEVATGAMPVEKYMYTAIATQGSVTMIPRMNAFTGCSPNVRSTAQYTEAPTHRRYNRGVGVSYVEYARGVFRPLQLESVFLFVTSTCNSLCRTCFYWDELNSGRDLTFEQIERISVTAPKFHKLWISGGEPFLRKELAEIIELFYTNNGVRHINLPTNGLVPQKVEAVIDQVLARCPELAIDLNFSLDGLANTHDAIRGVPNNFQKTLATIELAAQKWKGIRRLRS